MSIVVDHEVLNDVTRSIEGIYGDDPLKEADELFKFAESPEQLDELVEERVNDHVPVAYLTGVCKFYELEFKCDPRALIPRAETETLVDAGIESPLGAKVADVGTGCGSVAIALKKERPDLEITGIDISKEALDLAWINSEKHDTEINLHEGDLLEDSHYKFNVVLANLPYLPTSEASKYLPEMTEKEPEVALWGGDDGFDLIKRLLDQVRKRPSVKLLALEIGLDTHATVMDLVRAAGFPTVYGINDKKDQVRAVVGKKS